MVSALIASWLVLLIIYEGISGNNRVDLPSDCEFIKINDSFLCAVNGEIPEEFIPGGCATEGLAGIRVKTGDTLSIDGCSLKIGRMSGMELLTFGRRIDLNGATAEDLDALPFIGKKTAAEIVAFREENGLFQEADDLLEVKGIGEKTLEEIMEFIEISKNGGDPHLSW